VESEGLAENHRVVIDGSHPEDEPVGQRWGMVEPALWRRRHLGSTPSYQGVCGRHGGEEACVTQGGLVSSERKVWSRYCATRRRKGGKQGTQTSTWSHREVGADISEMRSSGRCGARSRSGARYSGTRSEQKASDRCQEQRHWRAQKARQRGKAPYSAESGKC
jgi:hypothetical protein